VYVLNPTAKQSLTVSGNSALTVAGTLQVDSSNAQAVNLSGSAVATATHTYIVGGYVTSGNAHFVGPVTTSAPSVSDPFSFLAPLSYTSGPVINLSGSQTQTIGPGTYASITVSGSASLTMLPGTYIIGSGGITVSGSGTITGTGTGGVLIYNTGAFTVSAGGSVNLTAITTGEYAGIAIFQARNDSGGVTVSGKGAKLNLHGGYLYDANTQAVDTVSGGALLEASLDVDELNISSGGVTS
jgi:hypothetical protein